MTIERLYWKLIKYSYTSLFNFGSYDVICTIDWRDMWIYGATAQKRRSSRRSRDWVNRISREIKAPLPGFLSQECWTWSLDWFVKWIHPPGPVGDGFTSRVPIEFKSHPSKGLTRIDPSTPIFSPVLIQNLHSCLDRVNTSMPSPLDIHMILAWCFAWLSAYLMCSFHYHSGDVVWPINTKHCVILC